MSVLRITSKMPPFSAICFGFAILIIVNGNASNAARVVRSPQFGGGFSQAQASAQSSGFGGSGFSPRRPYFRPPGPPIQPGFGHGGFGQGGYGQGGFGQRGFGQGGVGQGGSISISKSISISRGGASQSSAQSSAAGK